jgi:hypothetical protein
VHRSLLALQVAAAWRTLGSETGAGFTEAERRTLVQLLDRARAT